MKAKEIILNVLTKNVKGLTIDQICEKTNLAKKTVSNNLSDLFKDDLISKEKTEDKRVLYKIAKEIIMIEEEIEIEEEQEEEEIEIKTTKIPASTKEVIKKGSPTYVKNSQKFSYVMSKLKVGDVVTIESKYVTKQKIEIISFGNFWDGYPGVNFKTEDKKTRMISPNSIIF